MILLDTHIALWLATERQSLTFREMNFLNDTSNDLRVSAVSLWEMNVVMIALEPEHAAVPLAHPFEHKDPFDELLLIQAQELGLRLMTRDTKLRGHPLAYSPE